MNNFEYLEPRTVAEACQLLDQHGEDAKLLAGGLSLINMMKTDLVMPGYLINLKTVSELDYIRDNGKSGIAIGALTTDQDIIESPVVVEKCPLLVEAGRRIGFVAIRSHGTIGGNLCHGDPSADFPPALIALGAQVKAVSSSGERVIPVEELFVDFVETSLRPNEVLTEVRIPLQPPGTGWSFQELNNTANSPAVVSVAAAITLDREGKCRRAGLGLGSAGVTPLEVDMDDILVGQKLSADLVRQAAARAQELCSPIPNLFGSSEYKYDMVGVLTRRALNEAASRAAS